MDNDTVVKDNWTITDVDTAALRVHFASIRKMKADGVDAIRSINPEFIDPIRMEAEYASHDIVRLPGNKERSFIGNPPSWMEVRYNSKEYLWQMNRMNHWEWLCYAYALDKDEDMAFQVFRELQDWIKTVHIDEAFIQNTPLSYFSACTPLRALELGIRLYKTWPLIVEYLSASPLFTDEVLTDLAQSVHQQARLLYAVSPRLWPHADHNHFVMEMLGLLTSALYFPVFPESKLWRDFAIAELEKAARAQLTNDGGQIEGCPSYHDGCMFWFGLPLVYAKSFGFSLSHEYVSRYKKGLMYSLYAMRPTGTCVPAGDSHAGVRAVISGLYAASLFSDYSLLSALAVFISKEERDKMVEEFVWRISDTRAVLEKLKDLKAEQSTLPLLFFNRTLSQAMFRTSWDKDALSVFFTCRSPIKNNHAHIDLCSFDFTAYGHVIIADPGYFTYQANESRAYYKSTAAHNTLMVDGKNQFAYRGSFAYGEQKNGKITKVRKCPLYQGATATHDNYAPIIHYRHIVLVDKTFLLVIDRVTHLNASHITRTFNFDFLDGTLLSNGAVFTDKGIGAMIISYPETKVEIVPARLSDFVDIERKGEKVLFTDTSSGERDYLTAILPSRDGKAHEIDICKDGGQYIVTIDHQKYSIVFGQADFAITKIF